MCNMLYVSTTSEEDLSLLTPNFARFHQLDGTDDQNIKSHLNYSEKWSLKTIYSGCSCHFDHQLGDEPTFQKPEDWRPHDPEEIEATNEAYTVFCRLVKDGHRVEVIDVWEKFPLHELEFQEVSISLIDLEEFRFFEGYRFDFVP